MSSWYTKYDGLYEYSTIFLFPVVGLMLTIPTIEDATSGNRSIFSFPLDLKFLYRHMTFSKASLDQGRWWTAVTHIFLHSDWNHLGSNIFTLAATGYSLSRNFGPWFCYLPFLGGGVFGAVENFGKDFQVKQQLAHTLALPKVFGKVSERWDSFLRISAPVLAKYTCNYVGCSAGISAIVGMNVMISIENIFLMITDPVKLNLNGGALTMTVLDVLGFVEICNDFLIVKSGTWSGTGNAVHISRFCFGIGCYYSSKTISYWKDILSKKKRRQY